MPHRTNLSPSAYNMVSSQKYSKDDKFLDFDTYSTQNIITHIQTYTKYTISMKV